MKIGILTFHCAANYGAVFQTYGLQEALKGLGHEVFIVDYRPEYLLKPYRPFKFSYKTSDSAVTNLKHFVRRYLLVNPTRRKRLKLFEQFEQKQLHICPMTSIPELDILVFGSDQIWNIGITDGDFDDMYLGEGRIFKGKKLVAYAASAGHVDVLKNDQKLIDALGGFAAVAVREKSLSSHLEQRLNKSIPVVLDPVLLAGKEHFLPLIGTRPKRAPYLLTFQLGGDFRVSQIGRQMAKEKGLQYVEIRSSAESLNRDILTSLSPSEVLTYFKYADYIVTSSFHGTALSILFEKSFNVVSIDVRTDERADMLLKATGLFSRKIIGDVAEKCDDIDYSEVNRLLAEKQASSRDYLIKALQE
ncbi:MAG: polysaccharide pyruvyl transferase family protein [Alistipes sp.]|nr:polysaccharide pyruvyl transferase family protein [Alistipes sp.]